MGGARLYARDLFTDPAPANLPTGPAPLALGDVIDWSVSNGDLVINNIERAEVGPGVMAADIANIAPQPLTAELSAQRLLQIGFRDVAHWNLINGQLEIVDHAGPDIADWRSWSPALYAHCEGDVVRYIGKTKRTLEDRLNDYRRGLGVQNNRVHQAIRNALPDPNQPKRVGVKIFGFSPKHCLEWGGFKLNIPAGLEDVLIDYFEPEWNA